MNREIKFRAWTGSKMIFRGIHDRNWYTDSKSGKLVKGTHPDDNHFLKTMQFTGLKDKNGVEIYEGDVLINNAKKIGIVEYLEGKFCLKIMKTHCVEYDILSVGFLKNKEIIGNVYENPEQKTGF